MTTTDPELEQIYKVKCAMLCGGLYLPSSQFKNLSKIDQKHYKGRKGGAGPAGGRYFLFPNGSIVNSPIWMHKANNTHVTASNIRTSYQFTLESNFFSKPISLSAKLLKNPNFYQQQTSQGSPFEKIALMHGNRTLATTINQRCKYWRTGQKCAFCGIELSLNAGKTIEQKTGQELVETIRNARIENPNFASHMTLTIGTQNHPSKGMNQYLGVIKVIRETYPNIPIHIQIEPMEDLSWYQKLYDGGANSIGIHLEILDDQLRNKICPGKSHISKEKYFEHWSEAIRIFGNNQVSTFIITGFEQNKQKFKENLADVIGQKVIPLITPVRGIPTLNKQLPQTDIQWYHDINLFAAEKCIQNNVNPLENKAGCIRCGGCSPLNEAYKLILNA